jgi:hypothetical protein
MAVEQGNTGAVAPASMDTDSTPLVSQSPMGEPTAHNASSASEDREFGSEDRELQPALSRETEAPAETAVDSEERAARTEPLQDTFEPPNTDRSGQ